MGFLKRDSFLPRLESRDIIHYMEMNAIPLRHGSVEMVGEMRKRIVMERFGRLKDLERSFDLEFWQCQDAGVRFAAAWDLVVTASLIKGINARELRLQRSVENFQRTAR